MIREKRTGKAKDFPLSSNAHKALKQYLAERDVRNHREPLFPNRKGGTPLKRAQAWKILNACAGAVSIKERIGTHTLRKTFAYHAY